MNTDIGQTIGERWIRAAVNKNAIDILTMIDPDVELFPPFIEDSIKGIAGVVTTFLAFSKVTSNFRYGDICYANDQVILEFKAEVGGHTVHAMDILTLNERNKIVKFEVAARSPDAVKALGDAVANMSLFSKLQLATTKKLLSMAGFVARIFKSQDQ